MTIKWSPMVLALVCAVPSFGALAQDERKSVVTLGEWDAIRAENALLAERLKNVKLRSEISAASAGPSPIVAGQPPTPGASRSPTPAAPGVGGARATVLVVEGVRGDMTAQIALASGAKVVARVGMNVSGVGVVTSIKNDEVLVKHGKEIISLPFAVEPTTNFGQGGSAPSVVGPMSPTVAPPVPAFSGGR